MGDGDFQPANILTRSLLLRACVQASSKGMNGEAAAALLLTGGAALTLWLARRR